MGAMFAAATATEYDSMDRLLSNSCRPAAPAHFLMSASGANS